MSTFHNNSLMFPWQKLKPVSSYVSEKSHESFSENKPKYIQRGLKNISGCNKLKWEFIDPCCAKIIVDELPKGIPEEVICTVRRLIVQNTQGKDHTYVFTFTQSRYADWFERRHGI
ncbi:MAG: hypothetical protein P1V18_03140 [Candidatus Gracilibacteria bacterium]|nr:hypothetical protein [Candidatus Gracilibacteria bacterium]